MANKDHNMIMELDDLLICPISMDIMTDPVMTTTTGNTFDRMYIEKWIEKHGDNPIT